MYKVECKYTLLNFATKCQPYLGVFDLFLPSEGGEFDAKKSQMSNAPHTGWWKQMIGA
jgi:hypothetical protein